MTPETAFSGINRRFSELLTYGALSDYPRIIHLQSEENNLFYNLNVFHKDTESARLSFHVANPIAEQIRTESV